MAWSCLALPRLPKPRRFRVADLSTTGVALFIPKPFQMSELSAFFMEQATAGLHIQFVYDVPAGRVIFVNAAYQTVLGGTPTQVNAELPALLARLHPDDRQYLARYWKLWVRGQMPDEIEIRLPHPEAADQWFCLTPSHQQTPEGRVLIGGILRDISVQKAYQANADRFNTRKNATLEILSHDLSGSFAMVQQIAGFLRREMPAPAQSRVPELLRVLETTSQNSRKMIRDLVAVEFLSSANTDLKCDRVEVGTVLREPLDQLQLGEALLGHRFTYSLPLEPVYANLDVNKFSQVLINLVSNAFKFTPEQGQVSVAVEASPGCVRIQVQDNGIGIPAALLPRLFERFTPARRPGLRGEPTHGLGLMLCKTIVEWHQGTISVVSTEGQGTTFTVEIPQTVADGQ
jgi:two-component system sensor histidine kinase VicK